MPDSTKQKKTERWYRFSLRRRFAFCTLLGFILGLVSLQQQRQRRYFRIVEFVEQTFDSGGVIPNEIASNALPKYSEISGNRWVSSVARSPNNGPAFISSEHELIYRPSSNGNRLVDVTIVTSWHFLKSTPVIVISSDGGVFDNAAVTRLQQMLADQFGVEATLLLKNAG